jgi:hypothetical protein
VTVLSSKRFFIDKATTIPLDSINEWFCGIDRGAGDCALVITLEALDGKRRHKKSAARQLEELVADYAVDNSSAGAAWIQFGYRFCFTARTYFWNEKEIYVTANEALFLYRWLVLHDDTHSVQKYYLYNMRRRLGKAFLAEAQGDAISDF